jgi:hypothetical protein
VELLACLWSAVFLFCTLFNFLHKTQGPSRSLLDSLTNFPEENSARLPCCE